MNIETIRAYWNAHIHDVDVSPHPIGTLGFFQDLDAYRYDKLAYLQPVVSSPKLRGKRVLEVGCGIGTDLVRMARAGAHVTGVDLAETSIDLARRNAALHGVCADLRVMNGEALEFDDEEFDLTYAHGVLQYTASETRMLEELHRVLRPGGDLVGMVYNRYSWLNALSKVMRVDLEHEDAPVLNKYSIPQVKKLLKNFAGVRVVPDRFPVRTRIHHGWKAIAYNGVFVPLCDALPRTVLRPIGWHIMVYARRAGTVALVRE